MRRIGFIGFGEVGSKLVDGFPPSTTLRAIFDKDLKRVQDSAKKRGLVVYNSLDELAEWADLLFSCNSPAAAIDIATQSSNFIREDGIFIDCNNISPRTTEEILDTFKQKGKQFVKIALMSPIAGPGFKVPMLIGGERSDEVCHFLQSFQFQVRSVGDSAKKPASIKMAKSLLGKGLSTLLIEIYSFAKISGIESEVNRFLEDMFGEKIWTIVDQYMASVVVHSARMIPEMDELITEMNIHNSICEFPKAIKSVLIAIDNLSIKSKSNITTTSSHKDIINQLFL